MAEGAALIGLDVGTTGVKAIVFDADGTPRGTGFREYGVICNEEAMAEQDPLLVMRVTLDALREAVSKSGARSVVALGLSVQGDAIIPLDARLEPVYPALLGMDYRSAPEAQWCAENVGARRLFDLTGMRPHAINSIVKALWLKRHRADAWRGTVRIATYADYILSRLGAEPVIDWTMASRTMAFDLKEKRWSSTVLDALDLNPDLLSRAEPSGTVVGVLSRESSEAIGLVPGTLLVTGGHDQTCAALGAGMTGPGLGLLSAGTADVLSTASTTPLLSDAIFDGYYPCYLHAARQMYFTFALNHSGGILLRWFRDTFGGIEANAAHSTGRDTYDLLLAAMPEGPSPLMILPHFNGSGNPVCDMRSKGAVLGLSLATTRGDFVKAILESLTFELQMNLDYLRGAGLDVRELRAVGGGARSPAGLRIRADILGRPIATLRVREAACLGAAVLAGSASGVYSSVQQGVERTVRTAEVFDPDAARMKMYGERADVYREIYPTLRELNTRL
jgi:xylulokinase